MSGPMDVVGFDERRIRSFRRFATYYVMIRSGVRTSSNPSVDSVLLLGARFREAVEWAESRVIDDDTDALVFLIQHDDRQDVTGMREAQSVELFRVPPLKAASDIEGYRMGTFPEEY